MPWTKLWCPCVGRIVPLDHYSTGACTAPPMPIPRARGIVRRALEDKLHADGTITPSRLTSCPRATLVRDFFEVYLDPRADDAAYDGTLIHKDLEENAPPGGYRELTFPVEGCPQTMFLGVPIRGKLDFLYSDLHAIDDYKTHGQGSAYYKAKSAKPDEEDIAKLNLYRLCVEQTLGVSPKKLTLWHYYRAPMRPLPDRLEAEGYVYTPDHGRNPLTGWFSRDVPERNEAWIASVKPYGAHHTIGEIFDMYRYFHKRVAEGASYEEAISAIPLVGEPMFKGGQCSTYCSPGVRDKCFELAGRTKVKSTDIAFD